MKLKTALIGCGAIAEQLHLPVLAGHTQIDLVAIVDPNLERASFFAKGYNVPQVFRDVKELDFSQIEGAVIATPPFHHAPCALELMEKGLHVLVEKPMATNYEDALKMVELAEKKGLALAVVFFRRLYPSFRLLKGLIDAEVYGKVQGFHIEGGSFYNWPAASLGNMKKELAGGGVLMDLGPHFLDFLFQLFGDQYQLLEYQDDALGGIEADCTLKLEFQYKGQPVIGKVDFARTRKTRGVFEIECEKAILNFSPSERFKIKIIPKSNFKLKDFKVDKEKEFIFQAQWKDYPEDESWYKTFAKVYDDWIKAIIEKREPLLSGKSTLPIVKLIEECYQNVKPLKKSWVTPPDKRQNSPIHWKKRPKVLITGATGFIGCRVAEILTLREDWDVRAVVRNPGKAARLARLKVEMVPFDLEKSQNFDELVEGCDVVIHCAVGTAYGDPKRIFRVTVDGTRKLARAALKKGVKLFIHVSSMAVYGSKKSGLIDESSPVRPDPGDIYGKSKAKAEGVVQYYAKKGLPAVIFRPARVFGPFGFTFVTNPIQAMAEGRFAWRGDPDTPCDMIYVDNVAEAFISAIYAEPQDVAGEVFNLGEQDFMSWRNFYGLMIERLGLPIDINDIPIANERAPKAESLPATYLHNIKNLITSSEFKAFARKVIQTDPIGILPRKILEIPAVEELAKKVVGAGSLPKFSPVEDNAKNLVIMGGGRDAVLSIEKLKNKLSYNLVCSKEESIDRTVEWIKFSRIV
ncbi:MAG: NAD-dependent epimerase/dehydratase family protein [Desulfonauticus sp.]|nr:NAD-dependent epimerase/dehydratase family protein [Desulfonauticus sp.]